MELLWLIIGFGIVLAWFFAQARMVSMRGAVIKELSDFSPDMYIKILGGRDKSWLERGWYSPADIAVARRLHKAIMAREIEGAAAADMVDRYIKMARLRLYAGTAFFGVFIPATLVLAILG